MPACPFPVRYTSYQHVLYTAYLTGPTVSIIQPCIQGVTVHLLPPGQAATADTTVTTAHPSTDDHDDAATTTGTRTQHQLPFDLLIPQSTRGSLLSTYLLGVPWTFLSKAQADGTCRSVAERAAARFCGSPEVGAIAAVYVGAGDDSTMMVNASILMERTSLRR